MNPSTIPTQDAMQTSLPLSMRIERLLHRLERLAPSGDPRASAATAEIAHLRTEAAAALEDARKMEQATARLRDCIDLADVVLVMLDATGRIAMINAQGCKMLGYQDHELIGVDWFDRCVPPGQRYQVRAIFADLMAGEQVHAVYAETQVLTKSGGVALIAWHNTTLADERGNIIGTLSSGRDISRLRLAESALVESEKQLRALFDTTVDGIVTIDERGCITSTNAAAERMFGYTPHELTGHSVNVLMPPPYRDEHDGYLSQYLTTGRQRIIGIGREVVGMRKGGATFPIELAVSELRIGNRRMFTGVIRDITDRKRLEREVLEVSTQERERIGRDLHDGLGQELTGIAFLAGVLQRSLATAGRPEAQSAGEIVRLVNTTIDHTRALVRGLCPVTTDPDGLTNTLRHLAESVREVHRVRCRLECPRPVLLRDHNIATHLYYIALEAVNNAVKHARAREIVIGFHQDRGGITLSIADDGIGLAALADTGGRGMHIMNYRAHVIYGSLEVRPGPAGGTVVTCQLEQQPRSHKD